MAKEGGIDWGFGELAAFGSLLMEGTPVRLAGQDSRRGTFVQRHAVLHDRDTGAEWTPLLYLAGDQAKFWIYDSSLSEDQLDALVVQEIGRVLEAEQIPLSGAERTQLVSEIIDDVLGLGAIERYLADPTITEVMVNATDGIYVERAGRLVLTDSM